MILYAFCHALLLIAFDFPEKLEELPVFIRQADQSWDIAEQSLPYELNNALFSDYARKLRTIFLPIPFIPVLQDGEFDFPIGTVISKTFYYKPEDMLLLTPPIAFRGLLAEMDQSWPIETRVLVKDENGWSGVSYKWDLTQNAAYKTALGDEIPLSYKGENFNYFIPDKNQCIGCHVQVKNFSKKIMPLGPKLQNFTSVPYFQDHGWLAPDTQLPTVTRWPSYNNPQISLEERAKVYLHINCAHCHNVKGPAKSSGLFLNYEETNLTRRGLCKAPVAVGNGGGGHPYVIYPGKAHKSLLIHRIKSKDPQTKMPEIGRSLVHEAAVELLSNWINQLPGNCTKR